MSSENSSIWILASSSALRASLAFWTPLRSFKSYFFWFIGSKWNSSFSCLTFSTTYYCRSQSISRAPIILLESLWTMLACFFSPSINLNLAQVKVVCDQPMSMKTVILSSSALNSLLLASAKHAIVASLSLTRTGLLMTPIWQASLRARFYVSLKNDG